MAVDMFLELEGIKGESKDAKHAGKMEVLAWSWGLSNTGTFQSGEGGGAGKANFQDISFTKYVDLATADLMFSCASGKHIKKGTLIMRKAGGAKAHRRLGAAGAQKPGRRAERLGAAAAHAGGFQAEREGREESEQELWLEHSQERESLRRPGARLL